VRIIIIGGRGLIGSKVAAKLSEQGHDVIAASRRSGVDSLTGEGLANAVAGADVLVDVADSPLFDDEPVMHFFTTATTNLLAAEREAGVKHHVALSVVGAQVMPDSGYNTAKAAQENLIKDSGQPYSIVRATPFYEFAIGLADSATDGDVVRLPHALFRPIAADDVATAVARAAVGPPINGVTEIAGPDAMGMDDFVRTGLAANGDQRRVVTDVRAPYFGAVIDDHSLAPDDNATIFTTRYSDWIDATIRVTNDSGSDYSESLSTMTVLQEVPLPLIPADARVMTVLINHPPGAPGYPPHRLPGGPGFGYMIEGEMLFELEGEAPRVLRAGDAFWGPGGDVIHYRDANNRTDIPCSFVLTLFCVRGQPMLERVTEEELEERKGLRVNS